MQSHAPELQFVQINWNAVESAANEKKVSVRYEDVLKMVSSISSGGNLKFHHRFWQHWMRNLHRAQKKTPAQRTAAVAAAPAAAAATAAATAAMALSVLAQSNNNLQSSWYRGIQFASREQIYGSKQFLGAFQIGQRMPDEARITNEQKKKRRVRSSKHLNDTYN